MSRLVEGVDNCSVLVNVGDSGCLSRQGEDIVGVDQIGNDDGTRLLVVEVNQVVGQLGVTGVELLDVGLSYGWPSRGGDHVDGRNHIDRITLVWMISVEGQLSNGRFSL